MLRASQAADFGSPQEISGGRVMPGTMPFRIQRFFKPALVLLLLAGGVWLQLPCHSLQLHQRQNQRPPLESGYSQE
jgi:hypothetical protein